MLSPYSSCRWRTLLSLLTMLSLLLSPAVLVAAGGESQAGSAGAPGASANSRVWLDIDGNLLPFKTAEELLDFLRTAEVISEKQISTGVTLPRKVTLE